MFPIFIAIIITSDYFKWLPTFLAIAIHPLREEVQILQIWSIYSLNGLFSKLLDFLWQKIIEKYICRLIKGNWRENGEFLAFSKHFLDNFQDCHFLGEICICRNFFSTQECVFTINSLSKRVDLLVYFGIDLKNCWRFLKNWILYEFTTRGAIL